jgi:hypothetical protein
MNGFKDKRRKRAIRGWLVMLKRYSQRGPEWETDSGV